jgi:phage terminase large subunit-like protein
VGESFAVVVFADAGVETVVPAVHAADQVVAFDMTVRHQRAAVCTTTVQHGDLVIVTNDNEVNIGNKRVRRCAIFKIIPIAYGYFFH